MGFDTTGTVSELDVSTEVVTTPTETTEDENLYYNRNWPTYNGYYKNHNPVKEVVNKLGVWSVGRGITGEEETLNKWTGWGKDSAEDIVNNLVRVRHINGDSYAEAVREKTILNLFGKLKGKGKILNLKPLDPGKVIHVTDDKGILIRYEYIRKDKINQKFDPKQILHLILNRDANEVHGTGDIQSITSYLDKIKQLDDDMSVLFHKFVVPTIMFKLNTDNTTKIAEYKTNMDKALNTAGNIYIPQKAVEHEIVEAKERGQNATEWRKLWVDEVVRSGGVPALIMAQEAGTSEASSKMVVFTWEQVIRNEQKYVETQFKNQL